MVYLQEECDLGFDFEWYDQYCNNIFAKGHENQKNIMMGLHHLRCLNIWKIQSRLVKIFSLADNLVFSTELVA